MTLKEPVKVVITLERKQLEEFDKLVGRGNRSTAIIRNFLEYHFDVLYERDCLTIEIRKLKDEVGRLKYKKKFTDRTVALEREDS